MSFESKLFGLDDGANPARCPVPGCGYIFTADLEDVAIERHAAKHVDSEWNGVRKLLMERRERMADDFARVLATYDRDAQRLARWMGEDS